MIQAKKSLGQNFLVNRGIIKKIIDAAGIKRGETVIEVGPGTGVLTEALIAAGANIIAIEKDRRLIDSLKNKFPKVKVVEADILKLDIGKFNENFKLKIENSDYKVIGNLPYYITSHFLRTMLEDWPKPALAIFMVQKEVAQRIMALPAQAGKPPHMNLLALSVQFYAKPEIIGYVSRGSFRPVPKVDSAIIKLIPIDNNRLSTKNPSQLFKIIKKAFGNKRKQLKNTVNLESLKRAGIKPESRPEELSLEDWLKISDN